MGNQKAKSRMSNPSIKSPELSQKACSSLKSSIENLPDGITLIWLDKKVDSSSTDSQTMKRMLRELHSSVRFIDDYDDCLEFLRTNSNRQARVFLILSGKSSEIILPELHRLSVIDSVFIYCFQQDKYEHLISTYSPHLIGIYSNQDDLKTSLEIALNDYCQREPILNFFAQKQNNIRDLTQEQASFLWFQLLQKILIQTKYNFDDMKQMLSYCREHYTRRVDREKFIKQIDEFERTYTSSRAIYWYTRQSFIYKLINHALRTENIDALYIFRFYISDLSRQLANEHRKFSRETTTLTVYRGSHMNSDEFDRLKESIGRLISINGFVSTSHLEWVAREFLAKESRRGSNAKQVLWIITIDIEMTNIIFADVSSYSEHRDEAEILFNLGSVYKIDEILFNHDEQIWHVHVTATDTGSQLVSDYIDLTRREIDEGSEKVIFGTLLMDMGKYETAQNYFKNLIKQKDQSDLPAFHYNLGLTYSYGSDYESAEYHFEQAVRYQLVNPNQQRNVIRTKNALGLVCQNSGDLSTALKFYIDAESYCNEKFGSNDIANAQTYTYIGRYYLEKKKYSESIEYYERAMKILHLRLPKGHQRFGILLTEMGNVKREQGEHKQALDLYQQAEKIFEEILPEHHPCKAYCWSMMGLVYLHLQDIEKAQKSHEKALNSYKRVLPIDHVNIKLSKKNLKCNSIDHIIDTYVQVCAQV